MLSFKRYILSLVTFMTIGIIVNGQNEKVKEWPIKQLDSRITVKITSQVCLDADCVNGYITNNTSDTIHVSYECVVTGKTGKVATCLGAYTTNYNGVPKEIGARGNDINPGQTIGGDRNDFYIQFYGECKSADKSIVGQLFAGGNCIDNISFRVKAIFNISEMHRENAALKAKEEAKKEAERQQRKNEIEQKRKEEEAAMDQKKQAELIEKQKQRDGINNGNNSSSSGNARQSNENSSSNNGTNTIQNSYSENTRKQQAQNEENDRRLKAAQEEAEQERQKKVNDYNAWKTQATQAQNNADLAKASASIGMIALFWDAVYGNMGKFEPGSVFIPPAHRDRFRPAFYLNYKYGFSSTVAPILFRSQTSFVNSYGNTINHDSAVGTNVLYLNFGGKFDVGINSEYYSLYISPQIAIGTMPTFNGSNFKMSILAGADYGFKNVKLYGRYNYVLSETRSYHNSDPEETGDGGKYDMGSSELEYGLKFTFGGGSENDYIRHHLYLGMLSKHIDLGGSDYSKNYLYDGTNNRYYNSGLYKTDGYSFEWKKDHFFSFYVHVYPEHPYIGSLDAYQNNKQESPSSAYVEIGFLRALDIFTEASPKPEKNSYEQQSYKEIDTRTPTEKRLSNELRYFNIGFVSGKIAQYGIVIENAGSRTRTGIRLAARSNFTKDNQITDENGVENKEDFDLGPTFRIQKHLTLYFGIGAGKYKYLVNKNYYTKISDNVNSKIYVENSVGAIVRLGRVINISGGLSFMDLYKKVYTPEATFGLSINLVKRAKLD